MTELAFTMLTTLSFLVFVGFIDGLTVPHSDNSEKLPIILVPGFGGSQAYGTLKFDPEAKPQRLWLNFKEILSEKVMTKEFELYYNTKKHESKNFIGMDIEFPGWGDVSTIEYLDKYEHYFSAYMHPIIKLLEKDPYYVRNVTLRGAPYDFRRAPFDNPTFNDRFRNLVEETYEMNGKKRVIIAAHSMGTLYTMQFFNKQPDEWKQKYIAKYLAISGPFGGAVKALRVELAGENFGFFFWNPLYLRNLCRTFTALAFMIPDPQVWSKDEPIVTTPSRSYSAHDYDALFDDVGFGIGKEYFHLARQDYNFTHGPTGIDDVYCIHGNNVDTAEVLAYDNDEDLGEKKPTELEGYGDGTVNARSLRVCRNWKDVHYYEVSGASHNGIFSNSDFTYLLRRITGL